MERHYGLDWLRIGAFAVLILYHIGMVFVPWPFHAKLQTADWVAVPMLVSNPWRLALLFVVSGYASRMLLMREAAPGGFAWSRTLRLIVPLLFGIFVIVPPQPWVELVSQHGYPHPFGWFWGHDYFRFGKLGGIVLPTWQHLWFVLYLWLYTLLLALAVAVTPRRVRSALQRGFGWLFSSPALFLVPMLYLILVTTFWFPGARETHALFDDLVAHATYLPAFLFGVALAGSPLVLDRMRAHWRGAAIVAVLSYAVVAAIEIRWPGSIRPPQPFGQIFSAARAIQAWSAIVALIGFADAHWNRDHRWRAMLNEAVFPFYIIHQTVIVVVAFWLIPRGLSMVANFAILVAATVIGCWLFYLVGRSIAPLRPLIGLRMPRAPTRGATVAARPA